MPKRKKKPSKAQIKKRKSKVEALNLAKLKGISLQAAKDEIKSKNEQTSKLYSAGFKTIKQAIREKINKMHAISKFHRQTVKLVQGGAPGLGKKK